MIIVASGDRDEIIKRYLALSDITQQWEHLSRANINNREEYDEAIMAQMDYMANHQITRSEINEYKKRGVKRFDNVNDAMKSMFG